MTSAQYELREEFLVAASIFPRCAVVQAAWIMNQHERGVTQGSMCIYRPRDAVRSASQSAMWRLDAICLVPSEVALLHAED